MSYVLQFGLHKEHQVQRSPASVTKQGLEKIPLGKLASCWLLQNSLMVRGVSGAESLSSLLQKKALGIRKKSSPPSHYLSRTGTL